MAGFMEFLGWVFVFLILFTLWPVLIVPFMFGLAFMLPIIVVVKALEPKCECKKED